MSKLILGTVQFGISYGINNREGKVPKSEVFQILDYAYENGITSLDTASAYGESEEILGAYFISNPKKQFKVITKFNLKEHTSCEASLISSIDKLKIDSLEVIMFHSFSDYLDHKAELTDFISKYKGKLFNYIGISAYTNEEIANISEDHHIDLVQAPFNLLDNEFHREQIFNRLKDSGKIIHTRSAFLQGLFFKPLHTFPDSLEKLIHPIKKLQDLSKEYNIPLHTMAISYTVSKNYIDGVLFGVDSLKQFRQNVDAIMKLPQKLEASLDSIEFNYPDLLNPSKWKV